MRETILPFIVKCSHKNIVCMRNFFYSKSASGSASEIKKYINFVYDYVDGVTMDEYIKLNPSMKLKVVIMTELITAIMYLNTLGIYHRDIKPLNILITKKGIPLLLDLGLGCIDKLYIHKYDLKPNEIMDLECSSYRHLIGNKQTIAPELSDNSLPFLGFKYSDIYSLGITFKIFLNNDISLFPIINDMINPNANLRPLLETVLDSFRIVMDK